TPARATPTAAAVAAGAAPAAPAVQGGSVPSHSVTAPAGAVVVAKTTTAGGTLEIVKESAPHGLSGAVVRPNSSSGCAGSNPEVCFTINGSGLYVNYMENDTYFGNAGWADMQINRPG